MRPRRSAPWPLSRCRGARRAGFLAAILVAAGVAVPQVALADLVNTPAQTWGTNGRVLAILPVGDRVFVGGSFSSVVDTSGVSYSAKNIAVFSATNGRADLAFQMATNGSVNALATDGTTLFLGGEFGTASNGKTSYSRARLAAVDATTGTITGWAPSVTGSSVDSVLYAPATHSVYAGGNFTSISGAGGTVAPAPYVAKIAATTGAVDTAFAAAPDGRVRALHVAGDGTGRLFIGGDFLSVSGAPKTRALTALDLAAGVVDATFVPGGTNGTNLAPVLDIVSDATRLYVAAAGQGGACTALSSATGEQLWTDRANGNMQSVRLIGSTLYCGGHFSGDASFLGEKRHKLAAVVVETGALLPFKPKINSSLGTWTLGAQAGSPNLYVGGDFTKVSGLRQLHFAQFLDTTLQGPPQPPDNLLAQPDDAAVHLSWSVPSSDGGQVIKAYVVHRDTGGTGELGPAIATLSPSATTFDDNDVENGTTYYYRVVARNGLGSSVPSGEAAATPTDTSAPNPPGAPTSVEADNPPGEIDLTWNPPPDNGGSPVTSYNVYRGTEPGGQGVTPYATGITTISFQDLSDLVAGTTYFYRVSAMNSAGEGVVSVEVSALMQAGKPGPPVLSGSLDAGVVNLSWTVPPDGGSPILKYVVTRNAVKLATIKSPDITTYADTTVEAGQTYTYQVKAINAVGGGQRSNRYTVTVP